MTVVYNDALKTARLQAMNDMVAGKTPSATGSASAGQLVIGTANLSGAVGVLAIFTLPVTPFLVSGAGTVVATLQGTPLTTGALASGTAAKAELRNSAGQIVVSGLSVGTLNTDVVLASVFVQAGQPVTIVTSPPSTITHA